MKLTSRKILALLATKHSGDVFVPECKDGPTASYQMRGYGTHRRMDAWVMNKSWANATVTAYEIKVNRNDFLRDEKWTDYLPLCNCFYFVCPHGTIKPEELRKGVGLIYVSKTGTRLFMKRKAVHRKVRIPEEVWRYIMMCRVEIVDERRDVSSAGFWRKWLEEKIEKQKLGYEVSTRIRRLYEKAVEKRKHAEDLVAGYALFQERLRAVGIDPDEPIHSWAIDREIDELLGRVTPQLRHRVRSLLHDLEKLDKEIRTIDDAREENTG